MTHPADARDTSTTVPAAPPTLVIVGNLTLDDVVLPDGTTAMASVGGNSLYAALGARLWQPSLGLVTRRGEDFPAGMDDELARLGIARDGITAIPGPTVRNWVVYEANGDRTWIYRTPKERSREVAVQPGDVPTAWLDSASPPTVHIAAMPIDAAEAMVGTIRERCPGTVITLDTHEDYVAEYRQRLRTLASQVDAFLPSRSELADLVGYDDPERAVTELSALPTPNIIVKMGGEGVLVWDRAAGELHQVEPVPGVQVVDVTGAGDAFCGGFAAGLSLGCAALEAAQRGSVSAALAIAGFGSLRLAGVGPDDAQSLLQHSPPEVRSVPLPDGNDQVEVEGADRGIKSSVDIMREEIGMIPGLLQDQLLHGEQVHGLARELTSAGIEGLYLTGCGDSAFAGSAAALAFRAYAGIAAEGVHALDLARYRVRYLLPHSAVICISFSGKVGRTIEAAIQAKRFGHRVIALTGNAESPLAKEADDIITLSVPTLGYSPGTSTYLTLLMALFDLAVSWAEERQQDVGAARTYLEAVPDLARQTLERAEAPAREAGLRLAEKPWITFLGAGPNEATAGFGAAKLFEGPEMLGVATNIEEWAHEEYFISSRGTPVVMVAPDGASFDRAAEILSELRAIEADSVVIGARRPPIDPTTFIPIAPGLPETLSPILTALPLSLLAFHLTQARGQSSFEFASPEAAQEHYDTIHRATVGEPA